MLLPVEGLIFQPRSTDLIPRAWEGVFVGITRTCPGLSQSAGGWRRRSLELLSRMHGKHAVLALMEDQRVNVILCFDPNYSPQSESVVTRLGL